MGGLSVEVKLCRGDYSLVVSSGKFASPFTLAVEQTCASVEHYSNPRNKASSLHSTHPSPTSLRGRNYCRSLALPARLPAILDLLLFVLLEGRFGCLFMYIDSEGQHALSKALGENIHLPSL
jgi:hypothetical protein